MELKSKNGKITVKLLDDSGYYTHFPKTLLDELNRAEERGKVLLLDLDKKFLENAALDTKSVESVTLSKIMKFLGDNNLNAVVYSKELVEVIIED